MSKQLSKPKDKYKILNWSSYNESLKQRGSITVWFSEDAIQSWNYNGKRGQGGKIIYSDSAIMTCLIIRKVYRLKLRQTEGFMKSLVSLLKISLAIPDYSVLCRRAKNLKVCLKRFDNDEPIHIVVDSTGLKVYGEGEWKVRQHGWSKRRTWRKLHLGVNPGTHEIIAEQLTNNDVDDAEVVPDLLKEIPTGIKSFGGDGAYDKIKVRKTLTSKGIKQLIPPQKKAVISKKPNKALLERDEAIKRIKEIGRAEWKIEIGYHKRSLSEVAMFRYKTILGDKLMSRKFENEVIEARIGCLILNEMTKLGMPISRKAA